MKQVTYSTYTVHKTLITPHPNERFKVTVHVPKVWLVGIGGPNPRLCREFKQVWVATGVFFDPTRFRDYTMSLPYYLKPVTSCTKTWKSRTAAMKQFDAAVKSGLAAKFETFVEIPVEHLTLEHEPV